MRKFFIGNLFPRIERLAIIITGKIFKVCRKEFAGNIPHESGSRTALLSRASRRDGPLSECRNFELLKHVCFVPLSFLPDLVLVTRPLLLKCNSSYDRAFQLIREIQENIEPSYK